MIKKKCDDKEIECFNCHQNVKPILEPNKFGIFKLPFLGGRYSGLPEKKYILVCPNFKKVKGTK